MEKKRQSYNFVAVRGGSNPEGGGSTGGGANVVRIDIRGVASEEFSKLDAAWDDNNPPIVLLRNSQGNIAGDLCVAAVSKTNGLFSVYGTWTARNGNATSLISYGQILQPTQWLLSNSIAEQTITFNSSSYD